MNVIIIEDEIPAAKMLGEILQEIDKSIQVDAVLRSVAESKTYLKKPRVRIDLIFMDIRLQNETTFDLLNEITLPAPVIFVTAYDEFIMRSFEQCSIDYVMKPISFEKIHRAITKYHGLKNHFNFKVAEFLTLVEQPSKKFRERLLLKKGGDFFFINTEEIAYLFTDQTLVYIVDFHGNRFISEFKSLGSVEEELDPSRFFRASRKYILNIRAIKRFRAIDRVKLSVELTFRNSEEIIISQENASNFKNWVGNRNSQ